MSVSSAVVAHHGIVAGIYDDLEIGRIIDEEIPKQGQHKVAHSVALKAIILNALEFNERRLYIFPKFFSNIATERLLGPDIYPKISTTMSSAEHGIGFTMQIPPISLSR